MTNFKECINLSEDIVTTLDGKELILKGLHNYYGPLTMQLLTFGGIQGVNGGNLIIHVKNGYICPREIVYDGKKYTPKDFCSLPLELVNRVLPD